MAISAREMLLIVRAQNYSSQALRRVASDVGALANVQGLKTRKAQLSLRQQDLQVARQAALQEKAAFASGLSQLGIRKQYAAQEVKTASLQKAQLGIQRQAIQNDVARLRNAATISALSKKLGTSVVPAAQIGSLPAGQLKTMNLRLLAAQKAAQTFAIREGEIARATEVANANLAKQQIELQEVTAAEIKLIARQAELTAVINSSNAKLGFNAQKIRDIDNAISAARWQKVATLGSVMQHTSRVVQYAAFAIGGSLAYAADKAANFNTESTLAATQITNKWHQTAKGVLQAAGVISKELLNMALAGKTTASTQDNQKAIYDIYSSMTLKGSQASQIKQGVSLLKQFNQASIAGQVNVADVTHAGITILNNFARQGKQVQDLPKFLNRMFAAVRFGRMTVTEFVGSLSQVAPAFGAAFGANSKTFDQLSGALAFITRYIPKLSTATAGLARLSEMFGRPDFIAGSKKFGLNIVDSTGHLKPFLEIIKQIGVHFPKLKLGGVDLQNFFKTITAAGSTTGRGGTMGTIQARRVLQEFVLHAKQYVAINKQVVDDNNEFTKSFKAMSDTSGVKWQLFIQQMHAWFIEIGTNVIPVIAVLGHHLMEAFKWFNNLSDSTKKHIATYAAWAAVIALLGSGFSFLLGSVIRTFALLGRGIGFLPTLVLALTGVTVAIQLLHGNWDGLNGVIRTFLDFSFGSTVGIIAFLSLAAYTGLKLVKTLEAVRAGYLAVEASSGGAGLAAGAGGLVRSASTLTRTLGAGFAAGGLRGALAAASGAAAGISAPLLIAGGAITAAVAGGVILKKVLDANKASAEKLAAQMQRIQIIANAPTKQADKLKGLGGDVRAVEEARIQVDNINKQIRAAAKGHQGKDALQELYIQRANALDTLDSANKKADRSFGGMSNSIRTQAALLQKISQIHKNLVAAQEKTTTSAGKVLFASGSTGMATPETTQDLSKRIRNLTADLANLKKGALDGARALATNFTNAIESLSRAHIANIPTLFPAQIQHLFDVALKKGRMLTIPEIKANIQSVVFDKTATQKSVKNIPGLKLQAFMVPPKQETVKKVHNSIAQVFKQKIVQTVSINPNATAARAKAVKIGANIALGVKEGIDANQAAVIQAAVNMVDAAVAASRTHAGIKSPSQLMADKVGKPMGQGIAMGILSARGDITKAAQLTLDIFQGAILSGFTPGKKATKLQIDRAIHSLTTAQTSLARKHGNTIANQQRVQIAQENLAALRAKGGKSITPAMIIKDLSGQVKQMNLFNESITKLTRRGAPRLLIEQLAQLGISGAQNIAKLADMSKPQLDKYVALWKRAQKAITASARYTQADVKTALKGLAKDAAQNLLGIWQGFQQTNQSNFGDLFAGLDDKIGQGFQDALDQYNKSLDDYNNQITDLNKQMVDAQTQALQQAHDEVSQQFGALFSGDWLSSSDVQTRLDWGQMLGFDDLFKDLQSQTDKFKKWQDDLASLASKLPDALVKQLAAMGPAAVDKLDILNSATGSQLASYVALWKQGQDAIDKVANTNVSSNADLAAQVANIAAQIKTVNDSINALVKPKALTADDVTNSLNDQITAFGEYQSTLGDLTKRGLPAQLIQQLSQLGPSAEPYLKALNNMTDDQLLGKGGFVDKWNQANTLVTTATNTMMNEQLKIWYSYGANAAAQLIAGVSSEQQPLVDYFTKLFQNLLNGKTTLIPSAGSGGSNRSPDMMLDRYTGVTPVNTSMTTINVTAHQDESLQSTMERAAFRLTTRNPE